MKTTCQTLKAALLALVLAVIACGPAFADGFVIEATRIVKGNIEVMIVAEDKDLAALDETELADLDQRYLRSETMRASFPRLDPDKVEIVGHQTRKFNCIAWSMGIRGWVNPETGSKSNPLVKMDAMYASLGFVRLDAMNIEVVPGVEKVAVYAKLAQDHSIESVTHACRQEVDGTWTSKLGGAPLIRHADLESLEGPVYGTPVAIYVRQAAPLPAVERLAVLPAPALGAKLLTSAETAPPAHTTLLTSAKSAPAKSKQLLTVERPAPANRITADKEWILAQ